MTATEAGRALSELLTRVAAGETVEIDRHGQVVAVLTPPRRRMLDGLELIELIRRLPAPDPAFATDVRELAGLTTRPADPWRS